MGGRIRTLRNALGLKKNSGEPFEPYLQRWVGETHLSSPQKSEGPTDEEEEPEEGPEEKEEPEPAAEPAAERFSDATSPHSMLSVKSDFSCGGKEVGRDTKERGMRHVQRR